MCALGNCREKIYIKYVKTCGQICLEMKAFKIRFNFHIVGSFLAASPHAISIMIS